MRQIASFEESQLANRFTDYLVMIGIPAQSDESNDKWEIWVRDEDQLEKAKSELETFLENPQDSRYEKARDEAARIRNEQIERRRQAAKNTVNMKSRWNQPLTKRAPVTMSIVGICVILFVLTGFGKDKTGSVMRALSIGDLVVYMQTGDYLLQLKQGQIWRLLTPNLMHGGWIHIFFNMYMFIQFGSQIETRKAKYFYILLLCATGLGTMGLHLLMTSGPAVGMSGVVYGLFGYTWMKARFDPSSGFMINQQTILILVVWFFVCFTGYLGDIANWGHAGGLLTGLAIGYGPVYFKNTRR